LEFRIVDGTGGVDIAASGAKRPSRAPVPFDWIVRAALDNQPVGGTEGMQV